MFYGLKAKTWNWTTDGNSTTHGITGQIVNQNTKYVIFKQVHGITQENKNLHSFLLQLFAGMFVSSLCMCADSAE